ncbi:hypothetical protein LSH36_581g02027 [Paralvinella palmiformis]|uniref:TELO2-interacting protein 2 n=1 Tax=Paralvinella palmiformis TaxID=53620 RepID=A0AAD9J732_9ANNE|nr:hypothetical protein LSH36_581g02027 [Paralvinella palmiformis]
MAEDTSLSSDTPGTTNSDQSRQRLFGKLREICDDLSLNEPDRVKKDPLRQLLEVVCNSDFNHVVDKGSFATGETEQLLAKLAMSLYDYSRIREYSGKEDVGYVANDFDGSAEMAAIGMQCFSLIVSKLQPDESERANRIQKCVAFYALLLSLEHTEQTLWTSPTSLNASDKLLRDLFDLYGTSAEKLLSGLDDRQGWFGDILCFIRPRFMRNNWKQSPSLKHVFQWCLVHVKFPQLSDYLDRVLPACLLLLDDHEVDNQVMGVRCIDHIVDNVSKTELSWFGRADVIYDSLQKLTYSQDPQLIRVLHPCLLKILAAMDMKWKKSDALPVVSGYDEIFQRLLYNMEMESKLDARHAQSQHLTLYIETLGINTVKHFSQLFRVMFSFLEVYDGPHERTRINVLNALKATVVTCWPRIPNHCEQILKSLIKLLYETVSDRTVTPHKIRENLITEIVECLLLLKRLCPQRTVCALKVIKQVGLGSICTAYINNVLDTE